MLIGESPAFAHTKRLIQRIAVCDAPVLIEGETGTGKELVARSIHYQGLRRDCAFVPINCGALPDGLVENELFGHRRGAFTDARADVPGLLALADRGTLFLDEIDALSPRAQVTLLRFLQDRRYRPLGARHELSADVRIIAASNRDLAALAEQGTFRLDLLFRLKLLFLQLPPLRERTGDARLLSAHFALECSRRYQQGPKRLTPAVLDWVEQQDWPGNVRELENVVHRLFLMTDGPELGAPGERSADERPSLMLTAAAEASPASVSSPACDYRTAKQRAIAAFDREFLSALLAQTRGNVSDAARVSQKERRALGKLLKKYGIEPDEYRGRRLGR